MGNTTNSFLRDGAYVTDPVLVDSGAVYTPGISERRGTKTTYLHSGLKNAFAQSDTSQVVAATREYDAYGNVTSHTGAWEGPFGYAGKFGYQSASIPGTSTPDAGLQLLGHRTYDPSTGRFLTRDPIFDGRNWYAYGSGEANPITGADPTGLRVTWLYRLLDKAGKTLKWGITYSPDRRYSGPELERMGADELETVMSYNDRKDARLDERVMEEEDPGPLNRVPWAGCKMRDRAWAILGLILSLTDPVSAAQAAAEYCDENDEDWRQGVRNWYSSRAGFNNEDVFSDSFLFGT